jgi:hypothetical protein
LVNTSKYPWETTTSKYAVLKTITCFFSSISAERKGPASPWRRRHRYLRTVLPVLLQTETSRNGAAGHSERLFHRWFKRKREQTFKI